MDTIFFTPGPTQLHPRYSEFLTDAARLIVGSLSHRCAAFESIYQDTRRALAEVLGLPSEHQLFFLGSATEAMERILQNCVQQSSLHFINGEFSRRFYVIAQELGKNPSKIEVEPGQGFDLHSAVIPEGTELICLTQNETSTGVSLPVDDIHALKKRNPDILCAVDIVSSAPIPNLDLSVVDAAFFSVQKCFGLPAGLGVLMVNQKCLDRAAALQSTGLSIGSYHNFLSLRDYARKHQTPETPNVLGLYHLGLVAQDYAQRGMRLVRTEVLDRAARLYEFFDSHATLRAFVQDRQFRSPTVLTLETGALTRALSAKVSALGLMLGGGYGPFKDSQVRIANFPVHSTEMINRLIAALVQHA